MGKMRPLLPASAHAQSPLGGPFGASGSLEGDSRSVGVQRRDPGEDSSENGGESASNDGGQGRRKLLWPDALLDAMLRMRFTDPKIAGAIDRASSNGQKAAAWRQFADALSGLGTSRVSERQLRLKFAKIKWEYKRWSEAGQSEEDRRAMGRPPSYMPILRRWFGAQDDRTPPTTPAARPQQGSGDSSSITPASPALTSTPTRQEEAGRERLRWQPVSAEVSEQSVHPRARRSPQTEDVALPSADPPLAAGGVALLAQEAGRGMMAIADALKARSTDTQVSALLQTQHAEQMAVLRALLDSQRAQTELLERIAASLANK
jgi:hypothetical protein